MEAIQQLKTMRDDALGRLKTNPDYRLLVALDDLITDLEALPKPDRPKFTIVDDQDGNKEPDSKSNDALADNSMEEAFEQISAEIAGEVDHMENDELTRPAVSFS